MVLPLDDSSILIFLPACRTSARWHSRSRTPAGPRRRSVCGCLRARGPDGRYFVVLRRGELCSRCFPVRLARAKLLAKWCLVGGGIRRPSPLLHPPTLPPRRVVGSGASCQKFSLPVGSQRAHSMKISRRSRGRQRVEFIRCRPARGNVTREIATVFLACLAQTAAGLAQKVLRRAPAHRPLF